MSRQLAFDLRVLYKGRMATQIIQRMLDDLDGSEAAETIPFAFDGQDYEIDLSSKNVAEFKTSMSKWVNAARRSRGARRGPKTTRSTTSGTARGTRSETLATKLGYSTEAIRAWAQTQPDLKVAERGRVGDAVVQAYHEAQSAPAATSEKAPAKTRGAGRAASAGARKASAKKAPAKKAPAKATAEATA